MKAGYFNSYQTPKGVFFEAQSISFSSMDEDTFKGVFDKVLDIIIQDIGVEKEDVMAVLDEYS